MILFNLTASAQPILCTDGTSHTIPALGSADVSDVDARFLALEIPERFSLQDPTQPVVKKSKKERDL